VQRSIMQPHIKLLHIIQEPDIQKRKQLMFRHRRDELLRSLLELMCSPEFNFNFNFKIKQPKPQQTVPTLKTFLKFRELLLDKREKDLLAYIATLDEATKFVYQNVANQTNLGIPFKFIVETFDLFSNFNKNEYPIPYGFPTFPCHVQILPKDRHIINIQVTETSITPTNLDSRFINIDTQILQEVQCLGLKGTITGYISSHDEIFYVTNYYPNFKERFSERIKLIEKAILLSFPTKVKLQSTYRVQRDVDLWTVLLKDHHIICKQDIFPIFGSNVNMIQLDCDKLLELKPDKVVK